ncbi:MAG: reverse transcriptase/maturase family protein, partial [Actinobacteria bacterium]|nr:reverse transcriptase/maturase family protein [Actinomycetota bacterium]
DLFERATSFPSLLAASHRARRANRASDDTCRFFVDLEPNLILLRNQLRSGAYQPGPLRHFVIYEPKRRIISAAPFRDRVVHHALCAVLEPVFERVLTPHSFACRRGLGLHRAIASAQRHLRRRSYTLKADVRHYFETIDLTLLRGRVTRLVGDDRVLAVLDRILDNGAVTNRGDGPIGLPIGNLTSQHLANVFLGSVDRWILHRMEGGTYCRYMDDLLVFGDDKCALWNLHDRLERHLADELRLTLKREVSAVYRHTVGVPFLGMRIFRGTIRLGGPARQRLIRKLHRAERDLAARRIDPVTYRARVNGLLGYATGACTLSLRRAILFGE